MLLYQSDSIKNPGCTKGLSSLTEILGMHNSCGTCIFPLLKQPIIALSLSTLTDFVCDRGLEPIDVQKDLFGALGLQHYQGFINSNTPIHSDFYQPNSFIKRG
jgi:hypothetical protein